MIKKFNYSNKKIKTYLDSIGSIISIKKETYICKKDEEALTFFIILKGSVSIYQVTIIFLTLNKGGLFGEMSIFFREKELQMSPQLAM